MINIEKRWLELRHLDELAAQDSFIHRLHPSAKLVTALVFVVTVASFPKYAIAGLAPMVFYPVFVMSLGNIPLILLLKRLLLALPFVVFIGIFNPLFDQTPLVQAGPLVISGGWISFLSILLRFSLAVAAVLLLIATTGIDAIGMALAQLRLPRVFIVQILFMYRYLYVLTDEFIRMLRAHALRAPADNGVGYKVWGSLLGVVLLRTLDRAQRIYQAMLCRGFDGKFRGLRSRPLRLGDLVFLGAWIIFFLAVRLTNIPYRLGVLLTGGN
ncbi:cobalt ECF transporter T component CbiQ [Sporolituus thermophilus]|uniref:Cobalt/nickel transport system permease protein n=1 Tax=Sporolituus thermophilus DSM 23256 TaxID=1123285 RepID=A0A1G7IPZ3_9FIRM|nr:cobalt ECF transporter T component CbiQ [Sporolituus thermophilus]SDF14685.1 cobalt/nickel transport system permease protein [Sporolituus thermophilus DSM 23256]